MLRILGRIMLGLVALIVIGVVGLVIFVYASIDNSFPQTDGEISLDGLDGPVDIYRDQYGIPQIYASTEHDLFFAEGYVHAQDRFWQMDFQRHTGSGRLSELIGSNGADIDTFLRTMGWERVAKQELENMAKNKENRELYNQRVAEYNSLVSELNTLVDLVKEDIVVYNYQVRGFNECINN